MNKIEEKIKEAIHSWEEKTQGLDYLRRSNQEIFEEVAKEKAQEILNDLAVSSPDQLEVWVEGEMKGYFSGILRGDSRVWIESIDYAWPIDDFNIQLITPDGVVVMDNKIEHNS